MGTPRGSSILLLLFASFGAVAAQAQETPPPLGAGRHVVVSAERLLGFGYSWRTEHRSPINGVRGNNLEIEERTYVLGPLGSAGGAAAVYLTPRLGVDVFVFRGLSLGIALTYLRTSIDQTYLVEGLFSRDSRTTSSVFVAAPRVGYLISLGSFVSLWPRAGFTYAWARTPALLEAENTMGFYALTAEATVALRLAEHIHFLVAPTFDLGFRGAISSTPGNGPPVENRRIEETDLGLTCGVAGSF